MTEVTWLGAYSTSTGGVAPTAVFDYCILLCNNISFASSLQGLREAVQQLVIKVRSQDRTHSLLLLFHHHASASLVLFQILLF